MAKKRERKVTNPLGDIPAFNPLNMDHVNAIGGTSPSDARENPQGGTVSDSPERLVSSQEIEHKAAQASSEYRQPREVLERATPSAKSRSMAGGPSNRHLSEGPPKDSHQLKTRFTVQEAELIENFRVELSDRLGVKLRGSQISRALWMLALRAEEELDDVRVPDLRRPSYGNPLGMAVFEDSIADYLLSAIKKTKRQG